MVGVSTIHNLVKNALDVIADKRNSSNEQLLEVVTELEKILHPNNYIILGVKEIVIQRLMKSILMSKKKDNIEIEGNIKH